MEKRGLAAYRAKIEFIIGTYISFWVQPFNNGIEHLVSAFKSATDAGDLNVASYCCDVMVSHKLVTGEPLDEVYLESEKRLNFTRETKFDPATQIIIRTRRFIQAMQGLTESLSSFTGSEFDEVEYDRLMERYGWVGVSCGYYILRIQAYFMSGDYPAAIAARAKAEPILWSMVGLIHEAEYHFYGALALSGHDEVLVDEQLRAKLEAHHKQLGIWAGTCPENFQNRHALVSAEIARIEKRDLDAERLYEEAIRLARERGFIQNAGIANELAARFYAARGFQTIAYAYLRNARHCYLNWGADGKARQLDGMYPHLREEDPVPGPTSTVGAHVEHLDLATVLKVSQAVSGEIVLGELIKTLLRIAIEHAGAERGLLILFPGDEPRIAAEATTGRRQVEVTLRDAAPSPTDLPESVLHYVIRARESVILDDASAQNPLPADEYIRQKHARSALCLPLVKQSKLIGVLYLENNLASHVFTPARISVLEMLASQAAISLENARLYSDLQEREARIRRLVDSNIIGVLIWDVQGRILDANQAFLDMVGYGREDLVSGRLRWTELTPAEWRDADEQIIAELKAVGTLQPREKEYLRKDGSRVPVLVARALFEWKPEEGVSFVIDMTDRKRAEEKLRASEQRLLDAQMELAHVTRVTTLGEMTASIAHEVNQPLAGVVANAEACLRWLRRGTPDVDSACRSVKWIIDDGHRASEVIRRVRALAKKTGLEKVPLNVNDVVRETIPLVRRELISHQVSLRMDLAEAVPKTLGDRVQLQQVIINLVMNGIEAMKSVTDRPRELVVRSGQDEPGRALISVADCGVGISAEDADRLFNPFFTTKSGGLGMGLSICRSIMEAHDGRLWATANLPHGATFQFTLPVNADTAG
jgi:PAS domain S-box-containing protein